MPALALQVILASTRPGRVGAPVARWYGGVPAGTRAVQMSTQVGSLRAAS